MAGRAEDGLTVPKERNNRSRPGQKAGEKYNLPDSQTDTSLRDTDLGWTQGKLEAFCLGFSCVFFLLCEVKQSNFTKETKVNYLTIPKLAERLGITPASVRDWIKRGRIEEPPQRPVTGERGYSVKAAERIESWYLMQLAQGKTRGPGTATRIQRGHAAATRSTQTPQEVQS